MHTEIHTLLNIYIAIRYSEKKITAEVATCIYAGNFLQDAYQLSLAEKHKRFADLISLNQVTQRNTLHMSVNFAPGEEFPDEKMIDLAIEYMDRIGFGSQPYLVYRHFDAAHPHLHLVTTTIRPDGSNIDLSFFVWKKSMPACRAIEEKYGLVRSGHWKCINQVPGQPGAPKKLIYGKQPIMQAFANILKHVIDNYRFRSLQELNTILRLYNIVADPGKTGSKLQENGGLLYQALDDNGKRIGALVKSSSFDFKPGLKYLSKKFEANQQQDPASLQRIEAVLDRIVRSNPQNLAQVTVALRPDQIAVVPNNGQLSFVDLAEPTRKKQQKKDHKSRHL
jgi:hypothetical protein